MNRVRRATLVALLAVAAGAVAGPASASAPPPPRSYYVVLGDSLARGWQPDANGHDVPTASGYSTDVLRQLRRRHPGLRLVNFGCGGETTTTMVQGTICHYIAGSELAQAETFIQSHAGAIAAVSIDIGDNDVENCLSGVAFDTGCVSAGLAAVHRNLPGIVSRLRSAAGPRVPIAGLSDYDQFLALWLRDANGQGMARRSVTIVSRLNHLVQAIYRRTGVAVADATPQFATSDLADQAPLPGYGPVPLAVARVCLWTWACSRPPVGFDDHANTTGYLVLSQVIVSALRRVSGSL